MTRLEHYASDQSQVHLDGQLGVGVILLTLCFFQCLKQIFMLLPLPVTISRVSDEFRIFRWQNLLVSCLHACMTGLMTVGCVVIYFREMWPDMIEFSNWPSYFVCCFSTGYFIHDSLDILLARRIREKWEVLVHHTAIVVSAFYVIFAVHCVGYHVLSMTIEFNTAFLHFRTAMQIAGWSHSYPAAFRSMTVLNLVTFIMFRFGPLIIITNAIFHEYHRVPVWFFLEFTACMVTLNAINCILFYRLIRADFVKGKGPAKPPPTEELCNSLSMEEPFVPTRNNSSVLMYSKTTQ